MPVILTTWEMEIGRTIVQGQPDKKFTRSSSQPTAVKMVYTHYPSCMESANRRISVQVGLVINVETIPN
jgi:hypothetical protein